MATISKLEEAKHVLELEWGKIQWLCGQEIDPDCEMTFGMVFINADTENPRHYHPNCEELIFVLSGECEHSLGDESYHLTPGSMLRIPRGVPHNAKVTGWEPCRMLIMYSAPDRQTIGE